jgi:hypothetical protein
LRLRALQARGPSGSGIRPGAKRPHVIRHYRLRATTSVNAGTAPSDGSATSQAVQRRAERRKAPRPLRQGQGGAHVGGDAPHGVLGTGRHSALRPLGFAEGTKTRRPGGKHDGQPRGRASPRTISHGCLTSESVEAPLVSRTRCSAQPLRSGAPLTRDPGCLQRKTTRVPGLQRTTALRHSASKTRVNALMVLRCARDTR